MAIPPVNLFSNQPGGGILAGMNVLNDYVNRRALTKTNQVKAQYAPQLTQADVNSKNAYAQLVGLQPMSKVLASMPGFASLSEDQKNALVQRLYSAGTPGSFNSLNQMPAMNQGMQQDNSLMGKLLNKVGGIFGHPDFGMPKPSNALVIPQQGAAPMQNPMNQPAAQPQQSLQLQNIDDLYMRWMESDKGKKSIAENPYYYPTPQQMEQDLGATQPMNLELTSGNKPKTVAEKQAEYESVVAQGKKEGEMRPVSKKELDDEYEGALRLKTPITNLNRLLANPAFQKLRQLPAFQKLQLKAKGGIFGNQEENKLVGEFLGNSRQLVANTIKGFGGRILASEIPLAESMKISDDDTIGVMLGKLPVINAFNEMTIQRNRIASKLIKEKHLDKGEALEQADKMVNGDLIRQNAEDELSNMITLRDPITKKEITIPVAEARRRGVKNV
jgi:hypothetical protein